MSDQWLCLIDGRKLGPLTFTRLQQLAEAGRLKGDDYVRPAHEEQWLVAKNIPNLIPAPAVTPDRAESNVAANKRRNSGPLPVAQAIIEPNAAPSGSGIPRGKVVATPPPVGPALPPAPVAGGFPIVAGDSKILKSDAASPLLVRKKKNDAMPVMIGGAAVVGVLAIALALVLSGAIDFSGGATPVANADTEKKIAPPSIDEEFSEEEANPTDVDAETKRDQQTKPAARKSANTTLATVKQFLDITKRYRPSKSLPVQVTVTGLWLSASEQGEPYVVTAEGATDKAAKFLVIKLQIDNAPGAAPMDYQGWWEKALLFDDAEQAIQPLAPGKSPERVSKQRIEPGGSATDTLVFPLASVDFEKLRLVLPHQTVGIKDAKSFGLELPRHALGRGLETQLANSSDAPVSAQVTGNAPMEIIEKAASPMPRLKADAAKPKVNDDELGLNKLEARARELDKMEKKK